jgi:magnesium-protoporphyrin IX monomethyl ester (oxidative) cyclase
MVVKSPQKEKENEKTHFVRNPEFKAAAKKLQGPLRQIFVEFLERSCTADFSGFL